MSSDRFHILENFPARIVGLGALFVTGAAIAVTAAVVHRSEVRGLELLARFAPVTVLCFLILGTALTVVLIRYAEVSLALFFLIGLIKGDPSLSGAPMDLTIFIAGVLAIAVVIRLLYAHQELRLPAEYLFYIPILSLMVLSLAYTPSFSAGLDKTLRFVCLTSLGIVAPFVIFDSASKITRFMIAMLVGGVILAANSMTMLGGGERFVSPSGLNTELGDACAVGIVIMWTLLFPKWSLWKRILMYPVIAVLAVALVGSGARLANVAAAVCVLLGTFLCRKLFSDVLIMASVGVLALPFVWIPQASYEYLSSLAHPPQAMGTRSDLMALGIRLFGEHPFLGVGIQGFRFQSPNPVTYNFPHNLFLELGSEMGLIPVLAFLGLLICSFREIFTEIRHPSNSNPLLAHSILMLMIIVFLEAMVSGDINDLRFMWFVLGLPFVLRLLASKKKEVAKFSYVVRFPRSTPLESDLPAAH
jgi:O-antigen ligase